MADSDEDYVQELSDGDDIEAHQLTRSGAGNRIGTRGTAGAGSRGIGANGGGGGSSSRAAGWEVTRTWEDVVEGADGTINSTVEGLLEAGKRKRLLRDTTPLQRGIIRHLLLIMDLSTAMAEKDLRPTRYLLTIRYVTEFVTEFFEQNPISQLGIIGMRDGLAIRISDVSGNPNDHILRLQKLRQEDPKGQPSLQNALDMARGALFHAPTHTTREVLLIFGSLLSSDPGDIHTTITALVRSHITCTVIGLAAQVAICRTLVERTNPSLNPVQTYNVALNEQHYRELLMQATTPPTTSTANNASTDPSSFQGPSVSSSLLMMGFPSRIVSPEPTLCACHSKPTRGGYLCSRCNSKVCALPTSCPACGLTLILSTHLARSYHHLFPLRNWAEVSWSRAYSSAGKLQPACFGCQTLFPIRPPNSEAVEPAGIDDSNGNNTTTTHSNSSGKNSNKAKIEGQNHDRLQSLKNAQQQRQQHHSNPTTIGANSTTVPASVTAGDNRRTNAKGTTGSNKKSNAVDGVSESGRYECETCGRFFCIDCDVFAHEIIHNCPGCQSREGELMNAAVESRD